MKKFFTKILTLCLTCMLMMSIPAAARTYYPLKSFNIAKYGDSEHTYTKDGCTISKSKGPLKFEAIRYGSGDINNDGVYLDGNCLSPSRCFSKSVDVLEMDDDYNGTKWKDTITLKPEHGSDYTKELSNGSHTLKVVCWGSGSRPIVDTVTFNVVD